MSDYNPITNFEIKDALTTGDPEKTILGTDLQAEFDAIAAAIESKAEQTTAEELLNAIEDLEEGTTPEGDNLILIVQEGETVQINIGLLSAVNINSQTGTSYTLVLDDLGVCVEMSNGSANTLTVPNNSTVALPIGSTLLVRQMGSGQTSIAAAGGVTIRTPSSLNLAAQYSLVSLHKRDTNEWCLEGGLEPA